MILMFFLGIGLIVIDQITKTMAVNNLMGNPSIPIIDGFLSLTYVENRGAAWGIFKDTRLFLLIITTILIIGLFYVFFNINKFFKNEKLRIVIMVILAGAIGNMIDRVFLGYVVDFIQFTFINFPVFNFADMCVVCGSFVMLLFSFKE